MFNDIKVISEKKLILNNQSMNLNILTEELEITCKNNCEIFFLKYTHNLKLIIRLMNNSKLLINNFFSYDSDSNIKIIVNQKNNTDLEYRLIGVAKNSINLDFNNTIKGNNNKSKIIIRFLSEGNGRAIINVEGKVFPQKVNNEIHEEVKILSLNDADNQINPDILIASDDTIAIHNATISGVSSDDLFYLESKGLSKPASINLIKNGFLLKEIKTDKKIITNIKKKLLEGSEGNGY